MNAHKVTKKKLMKYRDIVDFVCSEGWEKEETDRHGAYGVACLMSFMQGTEPDLSALATDLDLSTEQIRPAFLKMSRSGLFSRGFNAIADKALLGEGDANESKCAWGYVAGIASGACHRNFNHL